MPQLNLNIKLIDEFDDVYVAIDKSKLAQIVNNGYNTFNELSKKIKANAEEAAVSIRTSRDIDLEFVTDDSIIDEDEAEDVRDSINQLVGIDNTEEEE